MGEPIGDPYVQGDICVNCWGPGKTFGDTFTPEYLYVTFAGFIAPNLGANKTFIATQDAVLPCRWNFEDPIYIGSLTYGVLNSTLTLWVKVGPIQIFGAVEPLCNTTFNAPPMTGIVS